MPVRPPRSVRRRRRAKRIVWFCVGMFVGVAFALATVIYHSAF